MWLLIGWIICAIGVGTAYFMWRAARKDDFDYAWAFLVVGGALAAYLVISVITSFIVVVSPTHAAVLKNEWHGTARYVSPGWRFINPIIETAEKYDMRLQEFQIGKPNRVDGAGNIVEMLAVDAGSNSPGLPLVYLVTTARVKYSDAGCPGLECDLVRIELTYGKEKWAELVKDRMEMNTREVAGRNPYDYVGKNRDAFAEEVGKELKSDMRGLADFAYVGIPWYDFSTFINEQLDQVAERERELEREAQNVVIAQQQQAKIRVEQETAVLVAEKQAEAKILGAEGDKQSAILTAEGQAEALRLVGEQLASNPLVIEYTKAQGWNGALPKIMGVSPMPFMNIEEVGE